MNQHLLISFLLLLISIIAVFATNEISNVNSISISITLMFIELPALGLEVLLFVLILKFKSRWLLFIQGLITFLIILIMAQYLI